MTDEKTKKVGIGITAAVLSVFFVGQAAFIINPAIASIAAMYPDIPLSTITYVSTIVSVCCIPFSLLAGSIAGTKIKYKTLALIAIGLITIGGVAGYFTTNFFALLGTRLVLGAGLGMSTPIGNAVIMKIYDGKRRATMQGLGLAVQNISGIILVFLSGVLVVVDISYVWLLHLVMIIPLIIVLIFFKEPVKDSTIDTDDASNTTTGKTSAKSKMPIAVLLYCIGYGIIFMCYYPILLNMSSIVTTEGIGTAALAGTIGSMYSIGGMLGGLAFAPVFKVLGRKFSIPVSLVLTTVCVAMAAVSSNAIVIMVAVAFSGFALFIIWPASIMEFGEICPSDRMAFASGLFFAFLNVGGFLASPYMGIIAAASNNPSPRLPLVVSAVIIAIVTVLWSILILGHKKGQTHMADSKPVE